MKALLSSIGSRGDVQPLVALGLELRALGHDVVFCVPPNFREWIEGRGFAVVPIGPDLRGAEVPRKMQELTKAQLQALAVGTVRAQFQVIPEAARGCDLILAATALQLAARSVAELMGIPYVFAAYASCVFPSPDHPPPKMDRLHAPDLPPDENLRLHQADEQSFNERFGAALNEERAQRGLPPVASVRAHIFTDRPWLAADPVLGPAGSGMDIVQTGAWFLPDPTPLPDELEQFLEAGDPPIYFGFGSMRGADHDPHLLVSTARALGRRAIILRGWAELSADDASDCLTIGEVDFVKLFPRVDAVVHHGGAGTTHAAARAGTPQMILPHNYDQYYWAQRVRTLGVGVWGPVPDEVTGEALVAGLRTCLSPETAAAARELAGRIRTDGAKVAAGRVEEVVADRETAAGPGGRRRQSARARQRP